MHRPADSRLLTNLLAHDKDYARALKSLLSPSNALSAYAAASTPPLSNALLQVSVALGGADEALARYADAVEECREQLRRINELEDDVGIVVRDRDILVTRLIKASKSHKNTKSSHRDSLQLDSASTLSLSSGFSASSPSKLTAAQAELQACEATLAQKERALQLGRVEAIREGLGLRCRVLMECGWVWAEVGKQALTALQVLQDARNAQEYQYPQSQANGYTPFRHELNDHIEKPLPPAHDNPTSTYSIPPAHAISDSDPFPASSSSYRPQQPEQRRALPRRITEETLQRPLTDEDDGGSSVDEPEAEHELRAIDNPRYFATEAHADHRSVPSSVEQHQTRTPERGTKKGLLLSRKGSSSVSPKKRSPSSSAIVGVSGFFGSLKGFFGGSRAASPSLAFYEAPESPGRGGLFGRKKGVGRDWETRTSRNLREIEREMRGSMVGVGASGPAVGGGAHVYMRESGRGRVVSDAGHGQAVTGGGEAKKKLRKGRSNSGRSSSVPPVASASAAVARAGGGGLFAETEIERRHLAALEPHGSSPRPMSPAQQQQHPVTPTPSPSTIKRQKSARKPPPRRTETEPQRQLEEGVKEGYTLTVLGSSDPHSKAGVARRASVGAPLEAPSQVHGRGLSRDGSMRSAASAPVGGAKRLGKVVGAGAGGKPMPSFAGVVRDGSLVLRQSAGPGDGSLVKAGQVGMEVSSTPPRVGEVLQRAEDVVVDGLKEARAPRSVFDTIDGLPVVLDPGADGNNKAGGAGEPSRARGGSPASSATEGSGSGRRMTRPAVSPLRSALRNSSRTPSPMPGAQVQPQRDSKVSERGRGVRAGVQSLSSSPTPPAPVVRSAHMDDAAASESDDEVFFEADDGTQENHESLQPSTDAQNGAAVGAEESQPPKRRKSVRVSLNPTFSATPPAIEYDDKEPWVSGADTRFGMNGSVEGGTKEKDVGDMWEDSSEEDVEYARARSLLSRLGGRKDKGKAKA
ncbi:hypothetical protein J132_04238 [Termitomyces sp. J132]|nr:hypothetical protein H2248_002257 [Termitomyces sp. 'cryptogamus']KNZ80846.1 hypothetical protein J132_04238 [Termitomyces sp. J132]